MVLDLQYSKLNMTLYDIWIDTKRTIDISFFSMNFDMYLWINKMIEALYALMGNNVQL